MKITRVIAACGLALLVAAPALAQQGSQTQPPGTPGPWGYHPMMWGGGWGWHPGFIFGPIMMLLALVGTVAIVLWIVRGFSHGGFHHMHGHGWGPPGGRGYGRQAVDILEERFARGEIDKAEFEEKRKLLGR